MRSDQLLGQPTHVASEGRPLAHGFPRVDRLDNGGVVVPQGLVDIEAERLPDIVERDEVVRTVTIDHEPEPRLAAEPEKPA